MPPTVPEGEHEMCTEVATVVNLDACTVEIPRTAVFDITNAAKTPETQNLEGAVFS